jgi:hypothetical protein
MLGINGDYLHILSIIGFIMMAKEEENNFLLLSISRGARLHLV